MKILKKYVIVFFACLSLLHTARAEINSYSSDARGEAYNARLSGIGAKGAAQVLQVHDQAQTEIQVLLVQKLDKVLVLLEAPKPKSIDKFTDLRMQEITKQLKGITKLLETPKPKSIEEITKLLNAPNPRDSATLKSLQNTGYILYGILTIGIILIFQLLLISSKLRNKKAEQDCGGNA